MTGQVVVDHGETYIVVWDGSLGPPAPPVTAEADVLEDNHLLWQKRNSVSRAHARPLLLRMLQERSVWRTTTLRERSGLDEATFWATLQYLKHRQAFASPRRGVIVVKRGAA